MKSKTRQHRAAHDQQTYRSLSLRLDAGNQPNTLDDKTRSVQAIAATETPCAIYDWERGEVVNEVLLMSGCRMPPSRQVPLLDTHARYSTSSVIGSCRDLRVEGGDLVGRAVYADVPEASSIWEKTRQGHLTDYSIGYTVAAATWVDDGQTAMIAGRTFTGPVKVATDWTVRELSACPIGADELAKARSKAGLAHKQAHGATRTEPKQENDTMDKKTKELLEARGLPKDATEEQALSFLATLLETKALPAPAATPVDVVAIRAAATGEERSRITEIDAMFSRFDMADQADDFIRSGKSVDEARQSLMVQIEAKMKAAPVPGFRAQVGTDERDKFRTAAEQAVLIRSGAKIENSLPGARDLAGYSLRELARHSLILANENPGGNPMEMVGRALMTGDFPMILGNIANKSLMTGWELAQETWSQWCATGEVSDFKTHTAVRASETDDLDQIVGDGGYKYGERSETFEQYAIATYGKLGAITRTAIINDDRGALVNMPQKHGEAAARKVGDIAYAVLTANSAMGDGVALFHATHANLSGASADPGILTVAAGILAMKKQKDIRGKQRLNIRPQYLIAPVTLEGEAEVFFRSERYSDSNTIATDSSLASSRVNPYSGSYFTRIYDPRLDDISTTAWYLAGPQGKTITVYFLNGQQAPYMEMQQGWNRDGVEYKVRIDAGAKAMDYRGLYKYGT